MYLIFHVEVHIGESANQQKVAVQLGLTVAAWPSSRPMSKSNMEVMIETLMDIH